MTNIHDAFKDEDVNGTIVGGDCVVAKLCYEGRQQGNQIYADSHAEAKEIAAGIKFEIKNHLGKDLFKEIYPDNNKWAVVFLSN